MSKENISNKNVKLVKQDGFVLYGEIDSIEQFGVWFKTPQKKSFISFTNIKEITFDEES